MATTTTNFGWDIPQSTDLVKDGATAIAALGQDIDTALVDLKGGTTGQVLSKASNTDLDFTWVAQDDSNAIQNAIVDAKGDLISATAADTPARLAVGTDGHVLTADSTTATGLKWAAAGSGKVVQIVTATTSTQTVTTSTSLVDTTLSGTITPTSASNKILVFVTQNGPAKTAANINSSVELALLRGSTNIQTWATRVMETDNAAHTAVGPTSSTIYLDSPATTSATTYKTQFRNSGGVTNQVYIQLGSSVSTIVLMEVTP